MPACRLSKLAARVDPGGAGLGVLPAYDAITAHRLGVGDAPVVKQHLLAPQPDSLAAAAGSRYAAPIALTRW